MGSVYRSLRNKSDEELPEELQELVCRALIEISGSTPAHIRDWTIADFVRGEPRGNTPKRDHPPYTLGQALAQE